MVILQGMMRMPNVACQIGCLITSRKPCPLCFHQAGYLTGHFGKWHLGGGGLPNGDLSAPAPTRYGFDESRVWNGNGPTWNGILPWPDTRYMDDDLVWNQHAAELAVDASIDFITRQFTITTRDRQ